MYEHTASSIVNNYSVSYFKSLGSSYLLSSMKIVCLEGIFPLIIRTWVTVTELLVSYL